MAEKKRPGFSMKAFAAGVSGDEATEEASAPASTPAKKKRRSKPKLPDRRLSVEVPGELHGWLSEMAATIRSNSETPIPLNQHVYPKHLAIFALEALMNSDVDWSKVSNLDDLSAIKGEFSQDDN